MEKEKSLAGATRFVPSLRNCRAFGATNVGIAHAGEVRLRQLPHIAAF